LWLAETSQQPISQSTWLKATPHCNHCNHCMISYKYGDEVGRRLAGKWPTCFGNVW